MLPFVLASALLISATLTAGARVIALRLGFVDHPGPRKIHSAPMPLLGGAAMYAAGLVSCLIFMPSSSSQVEAIGVLTAATMLIVVGMLDDRSLLSSQTKLAIAMPGAAVILLVSGVHAQWPAALLGVENTLAGGAINGVMTVVWVVAITAAMSILDHMDGLCAGTAAIASIAFLLLASIGGQSLIATIAASVAGASLGFLFWNFNPAKIFMGDGGAMLLGFMLATLGIELVPDVPGSVAWMVPALVLVVPIFDTTLVTISRVRRGLLPFATPGKDHTAHRLGRLIGQRRAVLSLYAVGTLGGFAATAVTQMTVLRALSLAAGVAGIAALAICWLECGRRAQDL